MVGTDVEREEGGAVVNWRPDVVFNLVDVAAELTAGGGKTKSASWRLLSKMLDLCLFCLLVFSFLR